MDAAPPSTRRSMAPLICSTKSLTSSNPRDRGLRKSTATGNPIPLSRTFSTNWSAAVAIRILTSPPLPSGKACFRALDTSSYGYLADIMNCACRTDAFNLISCKTHLRRNGTGKIGHMPLMACCIWVSGFNHRGHRLNGCPQRFSQPLDGLLAFLLHSPAFGDVPKDEHRARCFPVVFSNGRHTVGNGYHGEVR